MLNPMRTLLVFAVLFTLVPCSSHAEAGPKSASASAAFDSAASDALEAMKARAGELHANGVCVIAFAPGECISSWSSRMLVVGSMIEAPSAAKKGSNLLGIAYAKASEMAATLKDSGSGLRPPLTGEYGWQGGVVAKGKTGILIAAFSGGRSEDDVSISRAGLGILKQSL
jgi:hypothetical protein